MVSSLMPADRGGDHLLEGLTEAEATDRLARFGPNALAEERRHLVRRLAAKLTGPVPYLLEAAVVLELAVGKTIEAVIVSALIVFNGALSFVQEGRAANALAMLRNRLAVQARVRRDGHWQLVDAGRVVPGVSSMSGWATSSPPTSRCAKARSPWTSRCSQASPLTSR
jgi:magnesium-transporting ATPase (P-type)